ncbi:phosphoribosyl-AMP cyclohydrolase [Halalkalicoccus ordinarius]|uniref:phosphoribosyl-AMP cyclohydrolase n=1 Tax=Halalkalicoccus ordinarius TaxID=3116651 RepID=UPI00300F0505
MSADANGDVLDLEFDSDGLVAVIAQDAETDEVLMFAYATREAIEATRESGRAHYYSRSRDELWEKGTTSGHVQRVREIRVDCDADAVLYRVEQEGGACHTGHRSCFYRTLDGENVGERVFDPDDVYE